MKRNARCYFFKPSRRVKRFLRRHGRGEAPCPGKYDYHNASTFWDEIDVPVPEGVETDERVVCGPPPENLKKDFPKKCDSCDYRFTEDDNYQINTERMYQSDEREGEFFALRDLPEGAMYYADWMLRDDSDRWRGPDGHCLVVIIPGNHPWMVDARARNCTLPDDTVHKCWVRHGEVPNITVDKNGVTCKAGAGSIQTGNWHGFLRNGFLEEC